MKLSNTCHARYARIDDCLQSSNRSWLQGAEALECQRIRDAARRRQWLAGRILGRRLLAEVHALGEVEPLQILSRDARGLGTRPRVLVDGRELDCGLSIAHSARGVLVAVSSAQQHAPGVDLCEQVPTSSGFLRFWFTATEQNWIEADPQRAATAWAIKEAVYKAIGCAAPWNPRDVEVLSQAGDVFQCRYQEQLVTELTVTVLELDGHVAVIANPLNDVTVSLIDNLSRGDSLHASSSSSLFSGCFHD